MNKTDLIETYKKKKSAFIERVEKRYKNQTGFPTKIKLNNDDYFTYLKIQYGLLGEIKRREK